MYHSSIHHLECEQARIQLTILPNSTKLLPENDLKQHEWVRVDAIS